MNGKDKMTENALLISWVVALVSTLGSLFFSEVWQFIPCTLCWYQRIVMYPLVLILAVAVAKNDTRIAIYIWPLSLIGFMISLYHYLMQKTTLFTNPDQACGIVPCTTEYINWFGFITIPFLALVAFSIITVIHFYLWFNREKH
ncbi:disulfide oxidoreductase [Caldalkalibacillus salinus]|uniref:disulfide oxidoreductase n=1 Tax=Caldalkalibacillus salinus TaxID=2803787 RepID=UPI0019220B4E|nr:disulfide oxidoreductase [Caldalkalibacillus salinus]